MPAPTEETDAKPSDSKQGSWWRTTREEAKRTRGWLGGEQVTFKQLFLFLLFIFLEKH